jgi:hypothetical protein
MPINEKAFSGVMNLDDGNDVIPSPHHKFALNTRFRGPNGNNIVENIYGNRLITNTLPAGTNKCVGHIYDSVKNRLYYFNYNSNGRNGVYYLDTITKVITPVLVSFTNSTYDIFAFNPSYPLASVNIIYKDQDDGDTLYWTDRLNRPSYLNVQDALSNTLYSSGTQWQSQYLYVARKMPMIAPICSYLDDAAVTINNLKNTMYQFRYRWVYRDKTKSTWSPWSKLFAPSSIDSLANDVDPTKNNNISVIYNNGDADCTSVEIAARHTLGNTFSATLSIADIEKGASSSNSTQTFLFYNDSSYDYIDQEEDLLLFDYVPKKANAQELLNGNVLLYGGLTEGINMDAVLDVSSSVISISNTSSQAMTITSSEIDNYGWAFNIYGNPQTGDIVSLQVVVDKPTAPFVVGTFTFSYTVLSGDTRNTVAAYFAAQIDSISIYYLTQTNSFNYGTYSMVYVYPRQPDMSDPIQYNVFDGISSIDYASEPTTIDDVSISCYKHKSKYRFVLMYFDEFGVTDGSKTVDSMLISTPEMDTTGGTEMKIPSISFFINHQPPANAKYFTWGRSLNLTVSSFNTFVSASTEKDTNFGYIEITNLQTNQNNFEGYDFSKGDRIRIIGEFVAGAAGTVSTLDFPITDVVTAPTISSTAYTGIYIKVPYSASLSSFGTIDKYYCEAYRPSLGTDINSQSFYEFGETYEVGDAGLATRYHTSKVANQIYGTTSAVTSPTVAPTATLVVSAGNLSIGTYSYKVEYVSSLGQSNPSPKSANVTTVSGSQRVTVGSIQIGPAGTTARKVFRTKANGAEYFLLTTINNNSTSSYSDNIADTSLTQTMPQGAQFGFTRGDVYIRYRIFPVTANLQTSSLMYLVNKAASDLFPSSVAGNGRPFVIDPFARELYNPTLVRYGGTYQQGTLINETNRFFPINYDEYDRSKGDIQRLKVRESILRVFQNRGQGVVRIYATELTNQDGSSNLIGSINIINKINYYQGEYGIGNQYCSLASSAGADYFVDPVRGYHIRLGNDGITPISELYKAQYFFPAIANNYIDQTYLRAGGGFARILGTYDSFEEEFISVFQSGTKGAVTLTPYTVGFNEKRNAYSSFYSYEPEWVGCVENTVVSWKDGGLYLHDSATRNTFYGVAYPSEFSVSFNMQNMLKKDFNSITQDSSALWTSATSSDIATSLGQVSNLVASDYEINEGFYHAAFMRDGNSIGGLVDGNYLKGSWIHVKLSNTSTNFVYLSGLYMNYTISQRNG